MNTSAMTNNHKQYSTTQEAIIKDDNGKCNYAEQAASSSEHTDEATVYTN